VLFAEQLFQHPKLAFNGKCFILKQNTLIYHLEHIGRKTIIFAKHK
jgi:hypothetical protein